MAEVPKLLLAFDIVGPMAHFRKFYTNSSSLSYRIPPRTALMGLIAALLGRDRDSYYEELALEKARIGVALKTPVRTVMQTVNYLATDDEDWHGLKRRTQIPLELILPRPPAPFLRYRVFFTHLDQGLVHQLYNQLQAGEYRYPLYLGLTECPAWVENPRLHNPGQTTWIKDPQNFILVETVLPSSRLVELPPLEQLEGKRLLKDRVPLDFSPNRHLKAITDVLWEAEGRPIPLRVKGEFFQLSETKAKEGEDAFGTFLEP